MEIPAETLDVQLFFPPVSAAYRKSFFRPLIFLYYINTKAFQIYIKCFIKIFHFFFVKIIQGNFPPFSIWLLEELKTAQVVDADGQKKTKCQFKEWHALDFQLNFFFVNWILKTRFFLNPIAVKNFRNLLLFFFIQFVWNVKAMYENQMKMNEDIRQGLIAKCFCSLQISLENDSIISACYYQFRYSFNVIIMKTVLPRYFSLCFCITFRNMTGGSLVIFSVAKIIHSKRLR